jgi:hypothetical protein
VRLQLLWSAAKAAVAAASFAWVVANDTMVPIFVQAAAVSCGFLQELLWLLGRLLEKLLLFLG